ncbi:PREDICTED: putative ankyrin repeat domain-containing protein 31 [Gavialis gangeticus]|uniref:putative ankyrin repeat domain-containing protein 31 n=1 Tax=Gavialis gangeticus TaxID=94835 RepID=UPI00092F6581|nr:PREDICTED: putative ankyrin repeat domain-containing protein 31 [Gavialis gangeticus]
MLVFKNSETFQAESYFFMVTFFHLGVNSNVPVQHSHVNYGETAKKCYVKPSSRQNSVSNAKVSRLLNEKNFKDARLVPTKKPVTGSTWTPYIAKNKNSQKFSDHKTNMSFLDASKGKPSTNHKTHDSKSECNTRFTVANLSSKRITASTLHQSSSPENVREVSEKSSMHQQAEVQQHPDISDSINAHPLSEEKETAYKNSTSSVTIKEQRMSLQYTALSVTVEEVSAEQSETELTELDSHSVFSMCKEDGMPLVKAKECFMNHDNEDHCLKHTKEDSMIEKSMIEKSLDTAKSILSEQIIYSNNCSQQIEFDTDRERNNEEEQSLYPSLPLSEHSSLDRNQLQSGNLTPFSAQKAVNLPESDCAFLSEQYSVNEKQKIYKHLSQDINNCIGQTLQRNTETLSVHESLEPTNGGSVFEMPDNYSNGMPSHFAHQIDEEMGMVLGSKINAERCYREKTGVVNNSESNPSIALQLNEKVVMQLKRKRQDLQEINQDTDLCSTSSMDKNSLHPCELTQETQQDISQKSEFDDITTGEYLSKAIDNLVTAKALEEDVILLEVIKGWTAIHEASKRGFTEVILELLKAGADVNSKGPDGILPIHDAVSGNYFKHESIITVLQDIEEKQKKLLLFELRTPKDAEMYIQRLSQIQDTLNGMLAKQKTERDMLAKKYRASVESFKQGALRDQLVQLASRQKSLLMVAKKQKELGQKIQNCRNTKKAYSGGSKKQIPNSVPSTENDDGEYVTPDKRVHPDVVTVSMGPDVRLLNGNSLEAHLSLESRFSAQERSQYQNGSLHEPGANERAIRSKVVSAQALASENMVREWTVDKMSKSKSADAMEMVTLLSEPVCITQTECSQLEKIDYAGVAVQGSKSPNPIAVTSRLNISEAQNIVVNNNIHQPTTDCQQVLPGKKLQNYANRNEASQQQPRVVSESTENSSVGLQQNNRTSPNANLEPTNFAPNIFYSININQNPSSQFSHRQEKEQQLSNRKCRKKKSQLVDLLELGKIKPGEDVLEFKLQDFSHKATLLRDGRIQTSENRIHGNPVQWVKALLGNDISVSWKYAWNKVAYLGTELSKLLVEEASVPNKPEVTSQVKEPSESPIQFDLVKNSTNFLHFSEILLINNEEFLPCHLMEQYWKFYIQCEDFGF